jgi:hypothetical protein
MEKVESYVYELLKDNVHVKNAVKWLYQGLFSSWPGPRKETDLKLNTRPEAFFGFHDKSPWSADGELLLAHTFEGKGVGNRWKKGASVDVSVFQGMDWRERVSVGTTRAWNWQQGSQLQWLGEDRRIVYNDFRDGACVAVVQDLDSGMETLLPHPVAAVSPDGGRYASVCFETFGRAMPGYGYAFEWTGATSPLRPCELIVGRVEGGQELEISLADLGSHLRSGEEAEGVDFFSHCLFSPAGNRLLFLRRQSIPNRRLRSEMFCVDLKSHSLQRMAFQNMVSHFTWVSDDSVLAYANTESGGEGYYIADAETGTVSNCTSRFNDRDGHPHATPGGDRVVFDTYPDRRRYQRLFLWEKATEQSRVLARFYSPMKFWGTSRVDLHPRLRPDGQYVSFDASFDGVRSLVTAKLPPAPRS